MEYSCHSSTIGTSVVPSKDDVYEPSAGHNPPARKGKPKLSNLPLEPPIAVTVPTKNRPQYLAALLASLVGQTYSRWMLVINDQSDPTAESCDAVRDLLNVIRRGRDVVVLQNTTGFDRHQRAMEAVPRGIEWVVRVDDDVVLEPGFLEKVLRPWRLLPDMKLAAVGGCYAEPENDPLDLDIQLSDPSWKPSFDAPTWKLQGYHYEGEAEILEVETLHGPAIAYRRDAIEQVGGWAVEGYSHQAHREESDASARLFLAGYKQAVTTEARAWHLIAPSGGARELLKTEKSRLLVSDPAPIQADEKLFWQRIETWKREGPALRSEFRRYKIRDLERGIRRPGPWVTAKGRVLGFAERSVFRTLRRLVRYFR